MVSRVGIPRRTFRGETANGGVGIPNAEQRVMRSSRTNLSYRIMTAIPPGPPPSTGYPVFYVLDGNSVFATVTEAVRVQCRRPEVTGVKAALIVGIGYPTDEPFHPQRYFDYTPEKTAKYTRKPDGTMLPEQGGAAAFLDFIQEELKPVIAREYPVDLTNQTIMGHSLGGLFVLHTLFTRPEYFRTYIAGSPSIHWNREWLDEREKLFTAALDAGSLQKSPGIRALIAMGELENAHPSGNYRMAREMAVRLSKLENRGLSAQWHSFEEEGHVSVLPGLISRGLRFAFRP
ncbi:alpha/beta hydrolase [Paenibacillus chitinolyticus]|uniref:alpha/beta hydrolase n=1 Tax=Paenibacillus chitinolyticus TaxID=79263 RepID=UPI00366F83B3